MQFSRARIADFCQSVEREKDKFNDIFEKTVQAVGQPSALRGNPDAHALLQPASRSSTTYSHKAGIDLKISKS